MFNDRNKRGYHKLFAFASFLVILVAFTIIYSYYQYTASKHNSEMKIQQSEHSIVPIQDSTKKEQIEFQAEKTVKNKPIYVLLVGIDTTEENLARTDTIMIAQYHPKKGSLKLASIMRDSYVKIPNHGQNKVNASFFFGGLELLRQTIKENFAIDLHHYAMVNFDGFIQVVDTIAPKGLDVNIERNMHYENGSVKINFEQGEHRLTGEEVLNYVRYRSDPDNDFGRVKRQQQIMKLLKDELISFRGITKIPQLIGSVEPYIQTNVTTAKALSYAKDFIINPVDEVETMTIPMENSYVDKYYPHAGAVLELDIEKNKQALHEFFALDSN